MFRRTAAAHTTSRPGAAAHHTADQRRAGGLIAKAAGRDDNTSLYPSNNDRSPAPSRQGKQDSGVGVFWLLVANFALFALDKLAGVGWVQSLYLNGANPQWWQFLTCTFCHYNWAHLSQNAFFLYVFGKLVEEEEGAGGVWVYYLICGLGGALASYFLGGVRGYSLGASGAVFGLFVVSVLIRLQFNLRKLLESVILGQFVIQQVATEVRNQAAVAKATQLGGLVTAGVQVSHVAHLGGAVMGALLVLMLSRLPEAPSE